MELTEVVKKLRNMEPKKETDAYILLEAAEMLVELSEENEDMADILDILRDTLNADIDEVVAIAREA